MTPAILRQHLPTPGATTCIFRCGPPPMVDILKATLKELGYPEQTIILP